MADNPSPPAPIASGGRPASLANTFSNGTIGRIKVLTCTRDDPTGQGESFANERLRVLSRQYADHSSGRAPLPPQDSLWLRGEIDRLSQIVSPGQTSMWPDYSPAEKSYLAQQEAARQRAASDLGIAVGGPVFSALPAAGRALDAPEQTIEDLARINAAVAGAKGLGRAGRGIEPVRVPTRMPQTSQTWRSPGDGAVVAKGLLSKADFPDIAPQVSQKQLRHVLGRPEHAARGGGYMISMEDAQAVLDAYHAGSATVIGTHPQGFPIVRVEGVVGTNVNVGSDVNVGSGITSQPTSVFMLKGTASPSVVPINPNWTPK